MKDIIDVNCGQVGDEVVLLEEVIYKSIGQFAMEKKDYSQLLGILERTKEIHMTLSVINSLADRIKWDAPR